MNRKNYSLKFGIASGAFLLRCFLWSGLIIFAIIPLIKLVKVPSIHWAIFTYGTLLAFTILTLVLLLAFKDYIFRLVERYINTFGLRPRPYNYLDYFFGISIFTTLLHSIKVADIQKYIPIVSLVLLVLIGLFFLLIDGLLSGREDTDKSDVFLSDEAITSKAQDRLGVGAFVDRLAEQITDLPIKDSFVISLLGAWGQGKSSILNLLSLKLKGGTKVIPIVFEPSHYKDDEAILAAFYKLLENELNRRFILPKSRHDFRRYKQLISVGYGYGPFKMEIKPKTDSLEDIKNRIEADIVRTGKKLLIIIDEVERLQYNEVMLLLKLVRLNTRFKNTIFLLSYDPINMRKLNVSDAYLEKIIQKPIEMPLPDQTKLTQLFFDELRLILDSIGYSEETREVFIGDFMYIYHTQIAGLLVNLRAIKRYLNAIAFGLPALNGEVNLKDYLIYEAIRVFYPQVNEDILRNPWNYVPLDWNENYLLMSPYSGFSVAEDEKYTQIKNHLEAVLKGVARPEVVKELLSEVFFVTVKNALSRGGRTAHSNTITYLVDQRISHPDIFIRLTMLQVPDGQISDAAFHETISVWSQQSDSDMDKSISDFFIRYQNQNKLKILLRKVHAFSKAIPSSVSKAIILVLNAQAGSFSHEGDPWFNEYSLSDKATARLLSDNFTAPEAQQVLEQLIDSTTYVPFAREVVRWFTDSDDYSLKIMRESLDGDELKKRVLERSRRMYFSNGRNIFSHIKNDADLAIILRMSATKWNTTKRDPELNSYLAKQFEDDLADLTRFLTAHRFYDSRRSGPHFDAEVLADSFDLQMLRDIVVKQLPKTEGDEVALYELFLSDTEQTKPEDTDEAEESANEPQIS
jgi:hypothetical protein